jgi:hypothetical protein
LLGGQEALAGIEAKTLEQYKSRTISGEIDRYRQAVGEHYPKGEVDSRPGRKPGQLEA